MEDHSSKIGPEETVELAMPMSPQPTAKSDHFVTNSNDSATLKHRSQNDQSRGTKDLHDIVGDGGKQSGRLTASTTWTYRLVSAGLAFVVWGGWAYFVNSQQSPAANASPAMSGLLHGIFSSMVTIVMLTSVTWLYRRFAAAGPRMLIPAATTSLATGSCITTAHVAIGTANVAATVIPGLVVAFCFNLLTTRKLSEGLRRPL